MIYSSGHQKHGVLVDCDLALTSPTAEQTRTYAFLYPSVIRN
jgi:hypothetical protein